MEGILTKLQRSRVSIGVDLMRCAAVFALLLIWKEAASVPLSQGPSEQPAASTEQPGVNQSRGWPGLVTVNSGTPHKWFVRVAVGETDYDGSEEEEEEPTMPPRPLLPLKLCNYNRCTHMQVPCADLQREEPCLCPGVTSPSVPPEQPRVQPVSGITDHGASVHWCEPLSAVDGYQLVYWAEGSPGNTTTSSPLSSLHRVYTLDGLLAGASYEVCVQAFNPSGNSTLQGAGPCCVTFSTTSVHRLILYIGLGVCTLVLLSVACVLLKCYCARRRRLASSSPSPPSPSSMPLGLRNPTYEQDKSSSPPS